MKLPRPTRHESVAAVLLTLFGLVALFSLQDKSATWDEPAHFAYGRDMLTHKGKVPASLSRMAISQLNAAACRMAGCPDRLPNRGPWLLVARMPTIFLGILLGAFVFAFARRLYGPKAGLAALVLYVFSPTALAHTRWVTNDVALTLFFLATLFFFHRYLDSDKLADLALAALCFGLAQASKFTAVFLAPALILVQLGRIHGRADLRRLWSPRALGRMALFTVVAWLTLNAAYWFAGTFDSWNTLHLQSPHFLAIRRVLGPLPTLLPRSYLEAFDITFLINKIDSGRGYLVLFGRISRHPFPGYFLFALLFKEPVAALLLLGAALLSVGRQRFRVQRNELVLGMPAALLGVYFLFFCGAQIGVRYLLPLIVLGHVFSGRLWLERQPLREDERSANPERAGKSAAQIRRRRAVAWARNLALAGVAVSTLSYFPDFLSYFNILAWNRTRTYRVLADSNLDWGQNDWIVRRAIRKRGLPPTSLNPLHPAPGTWVVSGSLLAGVREPARYRWLRPLTPKAVIAHSHFLFQVTKGDLIRTLGVEGPFSHLPLGRPNRRGLRRTEFPNPALSGPACATRVIRWVRSPQRLCGKDDDFSFRLETWLRIERSGHYLLGIASDDGARLFVSGRKVIDIWSDHGAEWDHVVLSLAPGLYPLRIDFYERTGAALLQFSGSDLDSGRSLSQAELRLVHMAK